MKIPFRIEISSFEKRIQKWKTELNFELKCTVENISKFQLQFWKKNIELKFMTICHEKDIIVSFDKNMKTA